MYKVVLSICTLLVIQLYLTEGANTCGFPAGCNNPPPAGKYFTKATCSGTKNQTWTDGTCQFCQCRCQGVPAAQQATKMGWWCCNATCPATTTTTTAAATTTSTTTTNTPTTTTTTTTTTPTTTTTTTTTAAPTTTTTAGPTTTTAASGTTKAPGNVCNFPAGCANPPTGNMFQQGTCSGSKNQTACSNKSYVHCQCRCQGVPPSQQATKMGWWCCNKSC